MTGAWQGNEVCSEVKDAALCLEKKFIDQPDLLAAALILGIGFTPLRSSRFTTTRQKATRQARVDFQEIAMEPFLFSILMVAVAAGFIPNYFFSKTERRWFSECFQLDN